MSDWMLFAINLIAPIGVVVVACVAFGFALAAREALGKERGLHEAAQDAHDAALHAVTADNERQAEELDRSRRLLDCTVDAFIEGMTELREGAVPSPSRTLERLCASTPAWKKELGECTGLKPADVERLLTNDLAMTPALARRLEVFTGVPARCWEFLSRLHEEHRMEAERTAIMDLSAVARAREQSASAAGSAPVSSSTIPADDAAARAPATRRDRGSAPELPGDRGAASAPSPLARVAPSPAPEQPASASPPRPRVRAVPPEPPSPPSVPRAPAPVRLSTAAVAATLTEFPIKREDGDAADPSPSDWTEVERSLLNVTLPGLGSQ